MWMQISSITAALFFMMGCKSSDERPHAPPGAADAAAAIRHDAGGAGSGGSGGGGSGDAGAPDLSEAPSDLHVGPPVEDWVWGPMQEEGCKGEGLLQAAAELKKFPLGEDGIQVCQRAARNLRGIDFSAPLRCVKRGQAVWGEWEVPDSACLATAPPAPQRGGDGVLKSPAPLEGFADLHNHQMGHLGFGGSVVWGGVFGDPAEVLKVIPEEYRLGHTRTESLVKGDLLNILGIVPHGEKGYPEFSDWPNHTMVTHQQMYEDWLYRSYVGGLRLMVVLGVNSEDMFGRGENRVALIGGVSMQTARAPGRSTNDMEALEWQVREAYRMQADIDRRNGGPGKGWYRIVRDPDEASEVIKAGKLAVVLGVEEEHLFNCDLDRAACTPESLEEGLDRLEGMGVSYVFPIHHKQNQFGGSAQFVVLNSGDTYDCLETSDKCATEGLTLLGQRLMEALMARGLLVDVDHMSWRALEAALLIGEREQYPLLASHGLTFDMATSGRTEYLRKSSHIRRIFQMGGMMGTLLTGQGEFSPTAVAKVRLPISCGGADDLGNTLLYMEKMAGDGGVRGGAGRIAIGTDFNGFASWPGPRYGQTPCTPKKAKDGTPIPKAAPVSYPFALPPTLVPAAIGGAQSLPLFHWQGRDWSYNADGVAHAGLIPDMLEDLRLAGMTLADLEPLYRSARGVVDLWRRARDRQVTGDHHSVGWVPESPFDVIAFDHPDRSRFVAAEADWLLCRSRVGHKLGFVKEGRCQTVDDAWRRQTVAKDYPPTAVVAYHAGRCLQVPAGSGLDGSATVQGLCTGGLNQGWRLRSSDGQSWELVNGESMKCLALDGSGALSRVVQRGCDGGAAQKWQAQRSGNTFSLVQAGLCLEVSGDKRDDGAAVALATCNGAAFQKWQIEPLRENDHELLYQRDKGRIAWLPQSDAAHPEVVTVDGTHLICRSTASHLLGAVVGAECVGRGYDGAAARSGQFEILWQAR